MVLLGPSGMRGNYFYNSDIDQLGVRPVVEIDSANFLQNWFKINNLYEIMVSVFKNFKNRMLRSKL